MKYKLLVITVTYKSKAQELCDFINSYNKYNDLGEASKLVVIDNSPPDYFNLPELRAKYPSVTFIGRPDNPGFGASNNIGFGLYKSDYVLFMNNDTEFVEPLFSGLIKIYEADGTLGCIGIKQLGGGPSYFNKFTSPKHINSTHFNERWHIISGAFMFFKSAVFKACGMFDDNIFMYLEEFDISERLNRKGFHVRYEPRYSFLHKKGKYRKDINERLWIIGAQSQLYVCNKYGLNPRLGFHGVNKRLYKYLLYYLATFRVKDFIKVIRILKYRFLLLK